MLALILHWILASLVLLLIANFMPGIEISGFGIALLAILVMGLINLTIRPLLMLLTLPINILTLGLFAWIINAMMFGLAGWLVPGFEVYSFWSALLGSLLLGLITGVLGKLETRTTT